MAYLIVFIGSGFGGALRYGASVLLGRGLGSPAALSTLFVNVVGSLLMGFLVGVLTLNEPNDQGMRLFFATGLLGGFTTFSAFSLDVVMLCERGQFLLAIAYALSSIMLSAGSLVIALMLVRWLT